MKKIFNYNRYDFFKISNRLNRSCFSKVEENRSVLDKEVYHSELVLAYMFRSGMPVSFRFKLKLKLVKKDNYTMLILEVVIFKFYLFAFMLFVSLSLISYWIYSLIWLNLLWLLPIFVLGTRFYSKLTGEMGRIEKELT